MVLAVTLAIYVVVDLIADGRKKFKIALSGSAALLAALPLAIGLRRTAKYVQ